MKKYLLLLLVTCTIPFLADAIAPTIASSTPASGSVGKLVTITGTNLSSPTAFTIGGVTAIVVSNTGTTLVGMVMPGAATGTVSVTTSGGTAIGGSNFTVTPTPYPSTQQGPKLVGTGVSISASGAWQGSSVALSADGNTAIVGGQEDSLEAGSIWVYTRTGNVWSQQGPKLRGSGYRDFAGVNEGCSVSVSADGNTFIAGGYRDSTSTGAFWVFTRSGGAWTQQGPKLRGSGAAGAYGAQQGKSVSLSADGNTALIGGYNDSVGRGAVWVFVRTGTTWAQQGNKLVGTGAAGQAQQGLSVAISADGNTAAWGGSGDHSDTGAVWVFTRTGTVWAQQGAKLTGTGVAGIYGAYQGNAIAISADGNTIAAGGPVDNGAVGVGAVWVFTRSGTLWSQQGPKLIGTGGISPGQGGAVALSADGNTLIESGLTDNNDTGAIWIFTRSGSNWTQRGSKLVGTGGADTLGELQGFSVAISADGSTSIEGATSDNSGIGAVWIFSSDSVVSCSPTASSLGHSICHGDTFAFGTRHLTQGGTYTDTLTNAGGCDSIITLMLTVHPLPLVTLSWDSLVKEHLLDVFGTDTTFDYTCMSPFVYHFPLVGGSPSGGSYYGSNVLNDSLNFFNGNQNSTDTIFYKYTDGNACSATVSDTFSIFYCVGINDISSTNTISLYPNPNKGSFTLTIAGQLTNGNTYTICDMLGHMIEQKQITSATQQIDMSEASEGVYTLMVKGASPVRFVVVK
jgi:hypothetical protein